MTIRSTRQYGAGIRRSKRKRRSASSQHRGRNRVVRTVIAIALLALTTVFSSTATGGNFARAQDAPTSPEQQLAERFAPIVMIKKQEKECSSNGEQFRPVSVDILFGTDDVRLMKKGMGGLETDIEIKRNIQASDLFELGDEYYLDLPGDPREPECVYETWGKQRMAELGIEPSLYARVVTERETGSVVVQYWYYWVFNLFNNTHESDWEGIQLVFTADSVQQVLDRELLPSAIAFAQHEGGEKGGWDDDKVETQGTHIVSHPSSGSHADYYSSAVWLGWGENGSGFGCDYSDAPEEELPVDIIMLPNDIPGADSPFAWLAYSGRWGQRGSPSMFSGPTGPNMKPRWDQPVAWGEEIRPASLPVPVRSTIGPEISQVFCGAAAFGASIVRVFPIEPKTIAILGGAILLGLGLLAAVAWRFFIQAVRLYLRHGYFFVTVGVLAFPLAWIGQWIEDRLQSVILAQAAAVWPREHYSEGVYRYLLHTGLGGVQEIVLACIIGPVVIFATRELSRSEFPGFERTWKQGVADFPRVLFGSFYVALLLTVMTLTVVLVPLAIYKGVKWFFTPHAIVIDNAGWRSARHISAARISGKWIRAVALVIAVGALNGLPGPLIGTLGLIAHVMELGRAQWVSGAIYCVLYPIALIMSTLFYLRSSVAPGRSTPYVAPKPGAEEIVPGAAVA